MKTSEFIKKLDECGDKTLKVDNVFSDDELYLTSIKTNQFNITFYYDEEPNEIIDIIAEYLKTPVKERKEEKKYQLRQIGVHDRYLIWLSELEFWTTGSSYHDDIKTVFTQSEIDELPECYTHPAVWEQIEVESEEEC